jgi:cobalamin-dependent methionine synthase I
METIINDFALNIRERSILHFMGYPMKGRITENPRVAKNLAIVREMLESYRHLIRPAAVYRIYSCSIKGEDLSLAGTAESFSNAFLASRFRLAKDLGLFVVTIGSALEERVRELLGEARLLEGMILDAIGSEAAEAAANHVHGIIQSEMEKRLVRYSPGFDEAKSGASWKIADQEIIFRLLHPGRIGLSLSSGFMMQPRKSVSAIIGAKSPQE